MPDAGALRAQAEAALAQKPKIEGAQQQPSVSAQLSRVLDRAFDEAKRMEDDYVASQHLLLALDVVPRDALLAKIAEVTAGRRVTSQDPEGTLPGARRSSGATSPRRRRAASSTR